MSLCVPDGRQGWSMTDYLTCNEHTEFTKCLDCISTSYPHEEWRWCRDLEGRYAVSNKGRIVSLIFKVPKLVGTTIDNVGYRTYTPRYEEYIGRVRVHREVAWAFVDGYKPGLIVNHIDGNKLNNTPDNLEWTTLKENVRHAFRTGLHPNHVTAIPPTGERSPKAKLTDAQARDILESKGTVSAIDLTKKYNIGIMAIYNIWWRKTWRCLDVRV
jgi:hypothetical protein